MINRQKRLIEDIMRALFKILQPSTLVLVNNYRLTNLKNIIK